MSLPARQRTPRTLPRPARRHVAALGVVAVVASGLVATLGAPAHAATVRDGLTEATALASCWDVKQTNPSAASGAYWLYTPALGYPQRFYCDMTTDGGGWVLVGRGRQNWSFLPEGQGAAADIVTTPTGTAAFAPKALPTATVNGLLDGTAVRDLADGVRLRRATNTAGTTWSEDRVFPSTMDQWRWTLGGGYPLSRVSFNGTTYTNPATGSAIWSSAYLFSRACPVSTGLACVPTSSAGRLFDAVASLAGVRHEVTFEAQAAMALEAGAVRALAAAAPDDVAYPLPVVPAAQGPAVLDCGALVRAVAADVRAGVPADVVALRFHRGLAAGAVEAARSACAASGLSVVALSGGVFCNATLLSLVTAGLRGAGLEVLRHRRVPPNDGGLALGQVAVATMLSTRLSTTTTKRE